MHYFIQSGFIFNDLFFDHFLLIYYNERQGFGAEAPKPRRRLALIRTETRTVCQEITRFCLYVLVSCLFASSVSGCPAPCARDKSSASVLKLAVCSESRCPAPPSDPTLCLKNF